MKFINPRAGLDVSMTSKSSRNLNYIQAMSQLKSISRTNSSILDTMNDLDKTKAKEK